MLFLPRKLWKARATQPKKLYTTATKKAWKIKKQIWNATEVEPTAWARQINKKRVQFYHSKRVGPIGKACFSHIHIRVNLEEDEK